MELTFAAGDLRGRTRHDLHRFLDVLPGDPGGTIVALVGDDVVGFTTPRSQELIVHPAHRRQGHGTRLAAAARAHARARGEPKLVLSAPLGSEVAVAFLARLGFAYDSSLWLLRLPPETPVPPPAFAADILVRTYRMDEDIPAYAALINTSFVDHPSPLSVSAEMIRHVHGLPGFDPEDIALVAPRAEPERPVAFCRCVVAREGGVLSGEISLIGVLPAWRGRGLGRELLRWGVSRLRSLGAADVTLAVEARNELALGLYERTGFVRAQEWPRWSKAT